MGGVRNREEKKKKAHVYSSGGGGGTKGPEKLDKRNQEENCPYCDRIFKQKDRLKQHIVKQHAEEAAAGGGGAESSAQGAASAPAAPDAGPGGNDKDKKERMEVGSGAGYYTKKSPKVFLHEYCLREKRPTPKYQTTEAAGGHWTCKVVLPDPKKSEKDLVVFLQEGRVARDAEEAAQLAAVAALHRVQGDRALERVLPEEYRGLWEELGAEAKARAQAAAEKEAAAKRRKEFEKRRRDTEARRAPMVVTMSEEKRALVESALRSARQGRLELSEPSAASEGEADTSQPEMEEMLERLQEMGFRPDDATEAVEEVGPGKAADAYLDWLCLNVEEEHLPSRFAHNVESKPIAVRFVAKDSKPGVGKGGETDMEEPFRDGGAPRPLCPSCMANLSIREESQRLLRLSGATPEEAALASFGYTAAEAAEGLKASAGELRGAVALLSQRLLGSGSAEQAGEVETAGDAEEDEEGEWLEERVALEAIFGEEHCQFDSRECTRIRVDMAESGIIGTGGALLGSAELTAWLPPRRRPKDQPGLRYPAVAPVLALACPGLPAPALRAATAALVSSALGLLGTPMLYELASALPEILSSASAAREEKPVDAVKSPDARGDAEVRLEQQRAGVSSTSSGRNTTVRCGKGGLGPAVCVEEESARLLREWEAWKTSNSPAAVAMRRARASLPAGKQREEVLEASERSQVVVISGATGCGKSTQVPQFLLEQWTSDGRGGACNVVCTQPRRISAVGLASRVAAERGEELGAAVGYSVRLEAKRSPKTRLLFCTIGILLRRFLGDSQLSGTTHVVVDEVHERSIESDLLLLLLRDLAVQRPDLKIVLMSATADAGLFAGYFEKEKLAVCRVDIPGFTYPVREFYLEDIFERTGFVVGRTSRWAKKKVSGHEAGDKAALAVPRAVAGEQVKQPQAELEAADTWEDSDTVGSSEAEAEAAISSADNERPDPTSEGLSEQAKRSLDNVEEACVNYDLICAIVTYVIGLESRHGPEALLEGWSPDGGGVGGSSSHTPSQGALLIFLPGAPEISRLQRLLGDSPTVRAACDAAGCQLRVMPLHGSLPTSQQARVFERPPKNVRKVVLATNVAETSITIDDITCVIDSGRVKEMGFNAAVGMCQLKETWVSRAAAQQRRGRAGRVQCGICFRTFSRNTWNRMSTYQAPEILRVPLQGLCMQVRSILKTPVKLEPLLARALTSPDCQALAQAVTVLQSIQALDQNELLTPLGRHLAQLPLDVHIGKMLIHSVVLRCTDPCLTIAAALGHGKSLFFAPPDRREEAKAAKQVIAQAAGPSSKSDHLLVVAAYNMWAKTREAAGRQAAHAFCAAHFLSEQVLEAILASRRDLAGSLVDIGLIPPSYLAAMRGKERNGAWRVANAAAGNANMVKASLCAGFYPNILRAEHPAQRYKQVEAGTMASDAAPQEIRFFDRQRGRVFLHPSSANFNCGRFESNWLVFTEMVETSKVFVRDSSMVPAFAMLLFGGDMKVYHEEGLVKLDEWAAFKVPARVAVLLQQLRSEVGRLLEAKMEDTSLDLSASALSDAVFQLLETDGF